MIEVGCGTGAVLQDIDHQFPGSTFGLDINGEYLRLARANLPESKFVLADAYSIPIAESSFDLVFCHFLLMWIANPREVVSEMIRVTRDKGTVVAIAEPDYGGRIDYPHQLEILGKLQRDSLCKQGADPEIGRKIRGIFHQPGLTNIQCGLLGAEWYHPQYEVEENLEWSVLESDIGGTLSVSEFKELKQIDEHAWTDGSRILFVPTFFARGMVNK